MTPLAGGFGGGWGDPSQLPDWLQRVLAYQSLQPATPVGGSPPPLVPGGGASGGAGASAVYDPTTQPIPSNPMPPPAVAPAAYPDPTFGRGQPAVQGPEWRNMPWPSQVNPTGQHPVQTAIAANSTPGGRDITVRKKGAGVAAAAPGKNPFVQIAAQNQDALQRGPGRGPLGRDGSRMISALDLSSLFGNHPNPA